MSIPYSPKLRRLIEEAFLGDATLIEAWEKGDPALPAKLQECSPLTVSSLAQMASVTAAWKIVREGQTLREKAYALAVLEATRHIDRDHSTSPKPVRGYFVMDPTSTLLTCPLGPSCDN